MTTALNTGAAVTEVVLAPEGHDAAMAAAFDKNQAPPSGPVSEPVTAPAERPAHVPEKFWNAETKTPDYEGMAKAYSELEKKLGAPKEAVVEPPKPAEATADEARKELTERGVDFDALSSKFNDKGALDEADYTALEAAGIPKGMVNEYIEGQLAKTEALRLNVFSEVGGEKQYTEMVQWAATALSPADRSAYDKAVDSGDLAQIKLAAAGLQSRFVAANGLEPKLLNGGGQTGSGDVFRSSAEVRLAMSDPRYRTDEAYRQDVYSKMSRSDVF